jgi:rubrerythrin
VFSIREILGIAVKLEKNGERFYRAAGMRLSEPALASLLRWLAEEELRHMEWFTNKRLQLKSGGRERDLDEIGDALLRDILGDQTFSLQEVDLSTIHDNEALVDVAIEFESDTILFYEMLRSLVGDKETTEKLSEIIEEEKSHIESLRTLRPRKDPSAGIESGHARIPSTERSS